MKKLFIFLLIIVVVLITGCQKQERVICTTTDKNDSFTLKQTITMNFQDDTMKQAIFALNYDMKNDLADEIQKNVRESMQKYKNEVGITVREEKNDTTYYYQLLIEPKKVDKNILDEFGLIGETKLAIEDRLTGDGYTCKEG